MKATDVTSDSSLNCIHDWRWVKSAQNQHLQRPSVGGEMLAASLLFVSLKVFGGQDVQNTMVAVEIYPMLYQLCFTIAAEQES